MPRALPIGLFTPLSVLVLGERIGGADRCGGMIGEVVESDGLVALPRAAGDTELDSGIPTSFAAERDALARVIEPLLSCPQESAHPGGQRHL